MPDKQTHLQRQAPSQHESRLSPSAAIQPSAYSIPESLRVMQQVAAGKSSPMTIPALHHLQATIGNQAVQRLLQRSALIQRAPGDAPTADAANNTTAAAPTNDTAMGMIDYSMVAGHIAEAFAEYDAMVISVPDSAGGQAQIQVSLAYFINAFDKEDLSHYEALAAKSLRTEEEEETFANLQGRKNRQEIHQKAYNALKKPLKEAQPEDYNTILNKVQYGKGSALRYQIFIQTAVNKTVSMKTAGKSNEDIAKGNLPVPGETVEEWQTNIQNWVDKHHIGVDCSALVGNILNSVAAEFDLKRLSKSKQQTVATLAELHPGDVSIGPGHIRMVQKVEQVTDPVDPAISWLEVTLIESGSGVGGTNTRYLRFPTQYKGDDLLNAPIEKAIKRMQEINDSGKWGAAAAERKSYTFYRRLVSKTPKAE